MDFHKLLHGFFKVVTWICLICYMDLTKVLHGFVKVDTWICQSCSVTSISRQNQSEDITNTRMMMINM